MRVGVTGANGLLGTTLVPLWRKAGADVVAWDLGDFDVRDAEAVRRAVVGAKPDVVIHAAAYTAVDRAESEPDVAMAVNRDGTANVARACAEGGSRLVYISTDYVFDGSARSPIPPEAVPSPLGAYARSKAAGERAVRGAGAQWMIARSEWIFGPGGPNFVDTMRAAAADDRAVEVVRDQIGAPTSTRLLAEVVWGLVRKGVTGFWHVAAAGAVSWFEVARAVYGAAGADPTRVAPCTTAEAARAAARPPYSVLDCGATVAAVGRSLPAWDEHVVSYVRARQLPGIGLIEGEP